MKMISFTASALAREQTMQSPECHNSEWPSWLLGLLQVANTSLNRQNQVSHDNGFFNPPYESMLSRCLAGAGAANPETQYFPVAIFGTSDEANKLWDLCETVLQMKRIACVSDYNKAVGIEYSGCFQNDQDDYEETAFMFFLKNILIVNEFGKDPKITGQVPFVHAAKVGSSSFDIDKEHVLWKRYLYDNKQKLDPLLRVQKLLAINPTEKHADLLKQFIVKNTFSDADVEKLADNLLALINRFNCTTSSEIKHALSDYKESKGEPFLSGPDYVDLANFYQNHFFRNTSKLGLAFFAGRGYDINFAWNVGDNTLVDLKVVQDKPWKRGERRLDEEPEWITASEMRSVLKNINGLFNDKVFKTGFFKNSMMISKSLTSNAWQGFFYDDKVSNQKRPPSEVEN
ncbi:hypothetical protein GTU79_12320 [Sodalis ligni]|uniref:hypothetical protein n=1 Tax=Sodalis ligni TaxID=2697027 RepID=UPI00193F698D|nr:hypothetical protein [Sodalis ligni]QWA13325.1 hypothetical protein GTU79_12320 [Sodalis ligni]